MMFVFLVRFRLQAETFVYMRIASMPVTNNYIKY